MSVSSIWMPLKSKVKSFNKYAWEWAWGTVYSTSMYAGFAQRIVDCSRCYCCALSNVCCFNPKCNHWNAFYLSCARLLHFCIHIFRWTRGELVRVKLRGESPSDLFLYAYNSSGTKFWPSWPCTCMWPCISVCVRKFNDSLCLLQLSVDFLLSIEQ